MIDTTIATSVDSLYLNLHDSVNVVLRESANWTKADYIATISAGAVVLAVVAAFYVPWRERHIREREESEKTLQEYISSLLLFQVLLVSSLNRIKEFVGNQTKPVSEIPTFRLPLLPASHVLSTLSQHSQAAVLLESAIRAVSEIEHVNLLWGMSLEKNTSITFIEGSSKERIRKEEFKHFRDIIEEICKHAHDIILDGLARVESLLVVYAKVIDWTPQAGNFKKYFPE